MVFSIFFLILFCAAFHSSPSPLNLFLDIKILFLKLSITKKNKSTKKPKSLLLLNQVMSLDGDWEEILPMEKKKKKKQQEQQSRPAKQNNQQQQLEKNRGKKSLFLSNFKK